MMFIAMLKSGRGSFGKEEPEGVKTMFKTYGDLFKEDVEVAKAKGYNIRIVSEVVLEGYLTVETDLDGRNILERSKALISFLPAMNTPFRQ